MSKYYEKGDEMRQFPVGPISEDDKLKIEHIKQIGQNFLNMIDSYGTSRELSVAKTKIEEAVMWAVKGVTA